MEEEKTNSKDLHFTFKYTSNAMKFYYYCCKLLFSTTRATTKHGEKTSTNTVTSYKDNWKCFCQVHNRLIQSERV